MKTNQQTRTISHSPWVKIIYICLIFKSFTCASAAPLTGVWHRNSFAGPGHVENPGPWGESQGSDRSEFINYFKVSPANPNFMALGTDYRHVFITNGVEAKASDTFPITKSTNAEFHPYDGQRLFLQCGKHGWWETRDLGRSFRKIWDHKESIFPWGHHPVAVHPAKQSHIYFATSKSGLHRSTDDGKTIQPFLFQDGWSGEKKWTIHTISWANDGSVLYILARPYVKPQSMKKAVRSAPFEWFGADIWTWKPGDRKPVKQTATNDWWDVVSNPHDSNCWYGIRSKYREHSSLYHGSINSKGKIKEGKPAFSAPGNSHFSSIHPSPFDADDLILLAGGSTGKNRHYKVLQTTSGIANLTPLKREGKWVTNIVDYSPRNHRSPEYHVPADQDPRGDLRPVIGYLNKNEAVVWGPWNDLKAPLKSVNGGTWKPFAFGGQFKRTGYMNFGYNDQRMAIARFEYGILLSNNGGKFWRGYTYRNEPTFVDPDTIKADRAFLKKSAYGIAISPDNPDVVIATYALGPVRIMRTNDFGENWAEVGHGSDYHPYDGRERFHKLVFWHRQKTNVIHAAGALSVDGGNTWKLRPNANTHLIVSMSPSNGDIVLAKIMNRHRYAISLNGGRQFTNIPVRPGLGFDLATHIAIDPRPERDPTRSITNRIRLYSAGRSGVWIYEAEAEDGSSGKWFRSNKGMESIGDRNIRMVAVDPRPGYQHIVYAATDEGRGSLPSPGIFRSADAGKSWTPIAGPNFPGLPRHVQAQMVYVSDTGRLYFHATSGLYSIQFDEAK